MHEPVLIVGAGPVGLTLAIELLRYRVPVRLIDAAPARATTSRAIAIWPRTLELLDRAGCAAPLAEAGLAVRGAAIASGGRQIADVSFDRIASPWPHVLMLPQSRTEELLEQRLAALGGAVERGVALQDFTQGSDGVACTLRHADGRLEETNTPWMAGCDGAHSVVRHRLGLSFKGITIPTSLVLADVRIDGMADAGRIELHWHQDGVLLLLPLPGGVWRVMADIAGEPRHDPTLAEIQAIVDRRMPGRPALRDPQWLAGFSVNERMVRDYRVGRVFLAGDAAHVHSPAGGQGMNTGMQDAINLAWKLALVVHGAAAPALLDSYGPERAPVAAHILRDSDHMLRAATLRNPVLQHLRDILAHNVLRLAGVQGAFAAHLSEITVGYPGSKLNRGTSYGLHGPAPGERIVADAPFGTGAAPRFALMAANAEAAAPLLNKHADLLEPALRAPPHPRGIWLVRPDGYVVAAAMHCEWHTIAAALDAIAGPAPTLVQPTAEFSFVRSTHDETPILIPEIGLALTVRVPPGTTGASLTCIETVNAPGFGPPLHRHRETEIFYVLEGRYLFEVDGNRFEAGVGDVVTVPGGAAHGFVNISDTPARQFIQIIPGMDAAAFFEGLGAVMARAKLDPAALNAYGARWNVEFLGPPLKRPA